MRIPFPERIPIAYAFFFAIVLAGVQQLQQTDIVFSIYCFLFIVISTTAFNVTGGFTRPSGGYIFFYSFGVIAGITGKAILGEPADSNLQMPRLVMLVFLGGATSLLVAAFISRKLRTRQALLQNIVKTKDMRNATLGCMVTGIALAILTTVVPRGPGSILSALAQVNQFLPMAIILGTVHQIRKTGGASAVSTPVVFSFLLMFFYGGVFGFSKQGMFTPVLCWLVAAASMNYRLRLYQLAIGAFGFFIMFHYMVPFSQYGRDAEGAGVSVAGNARVALSLLTDLGHVREEYLASQTEQDEDAQAGYYNKSQGFLDRIQILKPDDGLINVTEERGTFGVSPIIAAFINLIPHVLYPNKPTMLLGNIYAQEVGGILSEDDFTTGISFTPSADAYHEAKWAGVLLIAPILWIMLFTLYDSICGDVRKSPWGLLMIALFSHSAAEGMLVAVIYMMGYTLVGLLFAAFAAAYVMPIIGTLLIGPEKAGQRKTTRFINAVNPSRRRIRPAETGTL